MGYGREYKDPEDLVRKTKNIFINVSILCGTSVVIAVTVKIIMTLFT